MGMAKLDDGSYLREVTRVGRPWGRLAVQVSPPVIPEDAKSASEVSSIDRSVNHALFIRSSFFCAIIIYRVVYSSPSCMQVLDKMTAMRPDDYMIPLVDVAGQPRLSTGDDPVDALIFKAMDNVELLALEGLKIQMVPAPPTKDLHRCRQPLQKNSKSTKAKILIDKAQTIVNNPYLRWF
jgi:hypothetical protein